MKSIKLAKFFGFYNQNRSFLKICAYCANPVKYLNLDSDSHDDLVCILTLIQRAVFIIRSIDILVSKKEDGNYALIFSVLLFLFSRQIAQILLFFNGRFIHILMRLLLHRKDLLAAERSHTYSAIALDPTYFLIYFTVALDSALYAIIKPFYLLIIALCIRLILKTINVAILYKTNYTRTTFAMFIPSALFFLIYPTFYIPVFILLHFSPKALDKNVDLSVLEYKPVGTDSSFDGSLLLANLEPLPDSERVYLDSIFKKRDSICTFDIPFMDERLIKMEPFWEVTYFSKQHLPKESWNEKGDTLHGIIKHETILNLKSYIYLSILKTKQLLQTDYTNASQYITKTIKLFTAIANSNLGLVGSVASVAHYDNLLKIIEPHINQITDTALLHQFAQMLADYPINIEWVMNSLRQEGYKTASFLRDSGYKEKHNIKKIIFDSLGLWAPDFYVKKWFDPEETYALHIRTWAIILKNYRSKNIVDSLSNDLLWNHDGNWGKAKLFLLPNTAGRIVVAVAIPNYSGYIIDTEDTRRYQELLLYAIALRYNMLCNFKTLKTLEQIDSTLQMLCPFNIQAKYSFRYDAGNSVLMSTDTLENRPVYIFNLKSKLKK